MSIVLLIFLQVFLLHYQNLLQYQVFYYRQLFLFCHKQESSVLFQSDVFGKYMEFGMVVSESRTIFLQGVRKILSDLRESQQRDHCLHNNYKL